MTDTATQPKTLSVGSSYFTIVGEEIYSESGAFLGSLAFVAGGWKAQAPGRDWRSVSDRNRGAIYLSEMRYVAGVSV